MSFPRSISGSFLDSNSVYFLLQIIGSNNFICCCFCLKSVLLPKMHQVKWWKRCSNSYHSSNSLYLSARTICLQPGTLTGKLPAYSTCFIARSEDFTYTLQSSCEIIHFRICLKVVPGITDILLHYLTVPLSHYLKWLKVSGISWNGWCQRIGYFMKLSIMTFYSLLLWKINFFHEKQCPIRVPLIWISRRICYTLLTTPQLLQPLGRLPFLTSLRQTDLRNFCVCIPIWLFLNICHRGWRKRMENYFILFVLIFNFICFIFTANLHPSLHFNLLSKMRH